MNVTGEYLRTGDPRRKLIQPPLSSGDKAQAAAQQVTTIVIVMKNSASNGAVFGTKQVVIHQAKQPAQGRIDGENVCWKVD